MAKHLELGKHGEELARNFLLENQFEVLESNWKFKRLEVDIIAKKENKYIFVEVKTRNSDLFGMPESAVDLDKQKNLAIAADAFLENTEESLPEIRFDIISVLISNNKTKIRHFEDAFFPGFSDE